MFSGPITLRCKAAASKRLLHILMGLCWNVQACGTNLRLDGFDTVPTIPATVIGTLSLCCLSRHMVSVSEPADVYVKGTLPGLTLSTLDARPSPDENQKMT